MEAINPNLIRYILGSTQEKIAVIPEKKLELFEKITGKITIIWGLRGAGKTTTLLQHLKINGGIYLKLDHFLFSDHKLYDIILYFSKNGYKRFYIDEIHTYVNWSSELKDVYDDLDVEVVASGSSALSLSSGNDYLGRRATFLHLKPLTFREYLELKNDKKINSSTVEDLLKKPQEILASLEVLNPALWTDFSQYVLTGGLPVFFSTSFSRTTYVQIINHIITEDMIYLNLAKETLLKVKKVLSFLASSPPGEVNFEGISISTGIPKTTIHLIIDALAKSGLLNLVYPFSSIASDTLRKQPKIYFSHPSFRHAILENTGKDPNIGAYREEFFFHSIKDNFDEIGYTKGEKRNPDFRTEKYVFEVGGAYKKQKNYAKEVILVKDEQNAQYPLILFGFL